MAAQTSISLIVFDGDDTLWEGLDGGYISGVHYLDAGRDDYTFRPLDKLHILRNDGQRFRMYPEVPGVLQELQRLGVLVSLASYNHTAPTLHAMQTFAIFQYFLRPLAIWSSQKDRMLSQIIDELHNDGYDVRPKNTLFIDDDRSGNYRRQMAGIGVHFLQKDVDITDLSQLLEHPRFALTAAQSNR